MKSVVITGPTGAIGIALINKLIKEEIKILALCRKNSKGIKNIPKSEFINVVECDLSELSSFNSSEKYDAFYHFAWDGTIGESRNDMYLQNQNIKYCLDAVNLAKRLGCYTFIGAGSQAEYGRFEGKLAPDTPAFPENGYGIAKLSAGYMSRVLCENLGLKHIWLRILSIYGPYDDENTLVMSTIKKLSKGESPKFTKGEQKWDYLYSEDAAVALYNVALKGKSNSIYCLGSGKVKSIKEYIEIIKSIINEDLKLTYGEVPYSNNQVMYLCADTHSLKQDIDFIPEITFFEGIKKILEINFPEDLGTK